MSPPLDLNTLAHEMKAAQDDARQLVPFTTRYPGFDLPASYEVARLVREARLREGARPVGRKIGFTNPHMWERFGVRHPIWSTVYDTTVVLLDEAAMAAPPHAQCRLDRFVQPMIEPEIVFGLGAAPRAGATASELLDAIEWVAHGFEIVQSHFPGWNFQAADAVADAALHATLLVGPRQPVSRLGTQAALVGALESFTLTLSCGSDIIETGRGVDVLGSPLSALAHLLAVLEGQPEQAPLQRGEIVTTGTVTTAQPIRAGQVWRSQVQHIALPGLTIEFV